MSDPVTALKGVRYDGVVTIEDPGPRGMIALRGDLSEERFRDAVARAASTSCPDRLSVAVSDSVSLAWMSPDELLVLCPYDEVSDRLNTFRTELESIHHLAVDMSDARTVLRLSGPKVTGVLSKLTPADLSNAAFPAGTIRRTRLAQIPAALWRRQDDLVDVLCFRSVADYAFSLLKTAASSDIP